MTKERQSEQIQQLLTQLLMGLLLTGRSSQMSVKEFEQYESKRMSKNAWIVANELVK